MVIVRLHFYRQPNIGKPRRARTSSWQSNLIPEESIHSSIGLDIESLSAEIQTECQNLETKHGVKQWPHWYTGSFQKTRLVKSTILHIPEVIPYMVAVVRLVAVVAVEKKGVCEGITIVVVDQAMVVMENKPVYCMRKEDLLPTLHFSGLRSLHCINQRSLLCISLVEGNLERRLVLIFRALNHVGEKHGESCDSLFKSNGQSCVSSTLSMLNQSEMM
ncbi:unnamed protein product [Camellia sinensis]